jgi:hypothetical protein
MSAYAWAAPVVLLLALLLIILFGGRAPDPVRSVERTDDYLRLQVSGAAALEGGGYTIRPLAAETRKRVLQNLSRFRAENRVVGPTILVSAPQTSAAAGELSGRIADLLAQYNLGGAATSSTDTGNASGTLDPLVLEARRADETIAMNLLAALSPMLAGNVTLRFDEQLAAGRMRLRVIVDPLYTDGGVAVFPGSTATGEQAERSGAAPAR